MLILLYVVVFFVVITVKSKFVAYVVVMKCGIVSLDTVGDLVENSSNRRSDYEQHRTHRSGY